jgi:hypothetical protein
MTGKNISNSKSEAAQASDQISVKEAGRRGGTMTRDRHGVEFYRQIGSKGGESTKKLYGHLFSELGKRGGRPKRLTLDSAGEGLPEKKGGEMRSAPESSSPV